MHASERPVILDRLPPGYGALFERAVGVLASDDRVRAMWLGGSLARGTADAASDLDVLLAVGDDAHEAFTSSWRSWLAAITPTVLAEELPFAKGSFYSVTPAYERLDVVVERVADLPKSIFTTRLTVFDRDDLTAMLPAPVERGPSREVVARLVTEWFRVTGMPEVLLVRNDRLLAAEHLHLLRGLIFNLYVEANQPLPMMGIKQWSSKLTPEQRATLEALPAGLERIDDLASAHVACARAFLGTARPLAAQVGVEWPDELEAAAAAHLREVLGVDEPYPENP